MNMRINGTVAFGFGTWLALNFVLTQPAHAAAWVTNAPMNTGRYYTTATVLTNGLVLVAGGYDGSHYTANAEIFNPTNGTWTPTAPMLLGRYKHTATLLPSGKVLVAGGFYATNNSDPSSYWIFRNEAELFDPVAQTWTTTGPLHTGRDRHVATLQPNGKVLVTGGLLDPAGDTTTSAELYDPSSGNWSVINPMGTARFFHSVVVLPNGKVLAEGGAYYYNSGSSIAYNSAAEIYDPTAGTWTPTGPMANSRAADTTLLLPNGTVLAAGGESTGGSIAGAELYYPASGTWTNTGPLNAIRERFQSVLLRNGKVLVAGGDNQAVYYATAEIYDPATGVWTLGPSLNTPRNNFASALLKNGNFLVTGGQNLTGFIAQNEIYTSSNLTVTAPVLRQTVKFAGGTFQFTFTNTPDVSFLAYAATNLSTPASNWVVLTGPTEVSPGQYQFSDPQATNNVRRYYRIRSP
jgi:hypothetical protein